MTIQSHGTGTRFQGGLTLLELLVTLLIASLLLLGALPSLRDYTAHQRLKTALATLHNDLAAGRGEAVHRNERMVACPGDPEGGCPCSSEWTLGWVVFSDRNGDRQYQEDELLLRHGQGLDQVRVTGSPGRTDVVFLTDGSTPGSNQSIVFCGLGGPEKARKLVISNVGRIRRDEGGGIDSSRCP